MTDLRRLAQPVLDDPPIAPKPLDELRARHRRRRARRAGIAGIAIVVVIGLVGGIAVLGREGADRAQVRTDRSARPRISVSTLEVGEATNVAIGATGVWVPGIDVVRRVDPERNAVVATIPVPGSSDFRNVTVAFDSVWVTDTGTGDVTRIDPRTNRVVATIPTDGSPTRAAEAGGRLWVAVPNPTTPGGFLLPIDPATNRAEAPLALAGDAPGPFPSLAGSGDALFVVWGDRLVHINAVTREVTFVPGGARDAPLHVAASGRGAFVLHRSGRVEVLHLDGRANRRSASLIRAAQELAVGGDDVWILTQPSSTRPSRLVRLDAAALRPVGRTVEVGLTASGIAASDDTTWVAGGGGLTRLDLVPAVTRSELCPGTVPFGRETADGLPAASAVVTDRNVADQALVDRRAELLDAYPAAVSVTVGPGYGRAWTENAVGRVTTVAVDDYALVVHFPRRDCPHVPSLPLLGLRDGLPTFAARDGARPPPAVASESRGPVSIRLELPRTLVRAGASMTATVRVRNDTGRPVDYVYCSSPFQVVLGRPGAWPDPMWFACATPGVLPTGETTFEAKVFASYLQCTRMEEPPPGFLRCRRSGEPPPLPAGRYLARLVQSPRLGEAPDPIPVRVVP